MNERTIQKLEWPQLLNGLAGFSQTAEGRLLCEHLTPNLPREQVEERWKEVVPLRDIASKGYIAPIGELPEMQHVMKAAELGQILNGTDFREVGDLLDATRKVHNFSHDFAERCSILMSVKSRIYPLPKLGERINRTVDSDGELLDDASEELKRIRRQKQGMRKRIEEKLSKILRGSDIESYLQDDFFTVRNERYVVPIRLDGRGRVKGSILDTSGSGQTLFIELASIAPMNEELLEFDLAEKLEILRIFRELSALVAEEVENLQINYDELVYLDFLTAQARLASKIDAGEVQLSDAQILDLRSARHPLLVPEKGVKPVPNNINIKKDQSVLIVSGPNAGGKTVVLKTVGLLHMMAKAGLLIPADIKSTISLYENIYVEMGDAQSLTANLSTFSGHILGLKPILEKATGNDLVLLDELAVGTDPQTGAAIGQAILENLAVRDAKTIVTTHYDSLKALAAQDKRFRNGSMEYSINSLKPTYRLILDVPGQSYGIEVAEQTGLSRQLIARAKELRGQETSVLDNAVNELMKVREESQKEQQLLARERLGAEAEKNRWKSECELLNESRKKTARNLTEKYEKQIVGLREDFDKAVKNIRKVYKAAQDSSSDDLRSLHEEMIGDKKSASASLNKIERSISDLAGEYSGRVEIPGKACKKEDLEEGMSVYVVPFRKEGEIINVPADEESIEVQVGMLKLRSLPRDLRIIDKKRKKQKQTSKQKKSNQPPEDVAAFVIQSDRNTLDLRGKDLDSALDEMWLYLDKALMRGEPAIILIHGHGTNTLKAGVRSALNKSPYELSFRPGEDGEGGSGVTVVKLRL